MKILVIETATEKSALILAQGKTPVAIQYLTGGAELSRSLANEVKKLLDLHCFQPDLIAVGQGPGSYTGIRVGAALGQALSFGWEIPLTGVGSLEGFAPDVEGAFAVLVDGRSGGFYTLLGERREDRITFETPFLMPLSEAKEILKKIHYIGSPHPKLIQTRFKEDKNWFETTPDPILLLERILEKQDAPLQLIY